MPKAPRIAVTDVTLRDGMHAIRHQFSVDDVRAIAAALDDVGVSHIEVSHGDGLGGSTIQYGFAKENEDDLIRAAREVVRRARLTALLLPGIGIIEDMKRVQKLGVETIRIATHCTEADISEQHMREAKKLGLEVVGFLMMAHMLAPEDLAHQARLMASYGADVVYVVDSAGAMLPEDAYARVKALREALPDTVEVGFHAHHNLGLSIANSFAAVDAGATRIDASLKGLGAGAGNTPLEVFAAAAAKRGLETGLDLYKAMDAAEDVLRPRVPRLVEIDRASLTLGYAGVYSSFLLHAYRAAEQFGVDARDILVELGKKKVVGGQEDMILDVALALKKQKEAAAAR
ncbi:4-hydroxy-2-oxovalerate aldolase [Hydrogenibacillus schlegelii]|uniref:4-hydroxy-2-oxovalerate aldolase n=1 Tax=Hydrogenibacillus schlegelii TaxID=1484 RepID=A0A179ILW4_HYDSH|nr:MULTISPECIES: 4-hydroxy-2-oxovalerate aldolase [Hydrogenibacillus]OAR03628.1 4-hydroxy-2-oxovalerate aldolase [Hydrogenibacillus schlegelii]QZA32558.1 4-hydroxy-2-oxovalerate aldolase [Hydrogenibacillus sp. N12]